MISEVSVHHGKNMVEWSSSYHDGQEPERRMNVLSGFLIFSLFIPCGQLAYVMVPSKFRVGLFSLVNPPWKQNPYRYNSDMLY
jgi:hypothetical protein